MTVQEGRCPTTPEKVNSSHLPSWFVLLAALGVAITLLRVLAGAPPEAFFLPMAGLAITVIVDLYVKKN